VLGCSGRSSSRTATVRGFGETTTRSPGYAAVSSMNDQFFVSKPDAGSNVGLTVGTGFIVADSIRFDPNQYPENCLLRNLPQVPTAVQQQLIENLQNKWWFFPAIVVPFVLLLVIGGWGGTFQSGDASAYIVAAVIVSVTESIFQQREENFEVLRRLWVDIKEKRYDSDVLEVISIVAGASLVAIVWNMYFAIHDRHVAMPSVDWVQILIFFAALFKT
jgi:hypothetical protein